MTPYLNEQRQKAIEWLGSKWVLHKDNQIKRLKEPLSLERTMEPKVLKLSNK